MSLIDDKSHILSDAQKQQFRDQGYFVIDDFFSIDEVNAIRKEISAIIDRYPDVPNELVQIEPGVERGEVTPASMELGVRKLFRMALHNPLFRQIGFHPKMLGIATELLGPEVTLQQTMLLMKPPHFGGNKVWHQDNAYFRLTPNDLFGFWIACDDADVANGCMHVLPGSHQSGIAEHSGSNDEYGLVNAPSVNEAVAVPLKAGGALIFHGEIYHFTPSNTTERRRRALQYHYAASHCYSSGDGPFPPFAGEIVLTGAGADSSL